jgi:hypothetical protein
MEEKRARDMECGYLFHLEVTKEEGGSYPTIPDHFTVASLTIVFILF